LQQSNFLDMHFLVPPTIFLTDLKWYGCTQNLVIPTIRSSKPKSYNNSVCEGTNEIMRLSEVSNEWVIWSIRVFVSSLKFKVHIIKHKLVVFNH
jgi:hypothetical protein